MKNLVTNSTIRLAQKMVLAFAFVFFIGNSYATTSFHQYYNDIFTNLNSDLNDINTKNPRGYLTRKGVKYKWELERSARPGQYTYFVHREKGGKSNLVYNTTMVAIDNRSTTGDYVIKIFYSVNKGYKWDLDRKTMLRITYKKDGSVDYQATGQMAKFEDNNHGLSAAQFKEKTALNPNFSDTFVRHAAASIAYAIYKYPKMMRL
ncbi:hypothetical protein [Bernardetia sp.]|uniref:hypothetical protein n=1 Tax=Bernardetia sp. TaxID=1937974 RepID=UPI0025C0FA06|nr:hypothetical protein [Bernardetia sp.]